MAAEMWRITPPARRWGAMRGVQAAFSLSRSGQYGANSVLPEGPDPLMHPEASGEYPPGMGGMPPGTGTPRMPRPPSMPRRAHFANDVEQPLSPANVRRQERLAPMAQSPLMRQASMAGNGQVPPWFANAMGGQALRSPTMPAPHRRGPADWSRTFEPHSHNPEGADAAPDQRFTRQPTMPAPRRGPSDWSRDWAPQSSHSSDVDGGAATVRLSVNHSLNVDSLPTESFGLAQPSAPPMPGAMASPPTSPPPPLRGQLPSLDTAALSPRGLPPPADPQSHFASNPALLGTSASRTLSSGDEAGKTFSSGEEPDEIL